MAASSQNERMLLPLSSLPEDRPQAQAQLCAACGTWVDPLRAEHVLPFDDGLRFLCSDSCLTAFRSGTRARTRRTPEARAVTTPSASPRAQLGRLLMQTEPEPMPRMRTPRGLLLAATAAALALSLGVAADHPLVALTSAVLSVGAAIGALWLSTTTLAEVGWLTWAAGPVGALIAALTAYDAVVAGRGSWLSVVGAALAASAVIARAWMERMGREPVRHALAQLVRELPARAHVPVKDAADPLAMALDQVDVATIRTGEEVIARRGELVAVDGVVQAGEARVLPFPQATTPVRRGPGDPVMAGARVVSGSLRLLATRVGDDRTLLRLARFGTRLDRTPSPLERIAEHVTRFGPFAGLLLAAAVALVSEDRDAAWYAASGVLIAMPVLAVRRATSLPASAAAAMAGVRGIAYHSGADLEVLGRVSMVALPPHGVLTEQRPLLVECHTLDGSNVDPLLGLAAAAERVALPHPVALAVERFVQDRRIAPLEVRRAVYHRGLGVTALSADGEALVVGSRRLLLQEGISVAAADAEAARAESIGRMPIFVALGGRVRGVMTLQYELRVGARPAIQRVFDMGLEVVLLTGAHRSAVHELATSLDIEHVKADLLPEERGQQVRNLREAGGTVAAIGRPTDDDAILAAADAGIVLGGAGGGAADKAVALVSDDVRDAAAALWIARAAHDASQRAVLAAAITFGVVVAAAAVGLMAPGTAALCALAVDAYCLPVGARLLHRIALRLPSRS